MQDDEKLLSCLLAYIAIALVVFGFVVAKFGPSEGGAAVLIAAVWPASGLIWLGTWIA